MAQITILKRDSLPNIVDLLSTGKKDAEKVA